MSNDKERFLEAVNIYKSGNEQKFHIARGKLKKIKLTEDMGVELLELGASLPRSEFRFQWPHSDLIECASRISSPRYYEIIKRDYLHYHREAWKQVIRLLAGDGSNEALATLREIVMSAVGKCELQFWPALENLFADSEEFADLPYFEWLKLLDSKCDVISAHHTRMILLAHAQKSWLSQTSKQEVGRYVMERAAGLVKNLRVLQRETPGSWMFAEEYVDRRDEICDSLDLLGSLEFQTAKSLLRAVWEFTDTRIKFFAAFALRELGDVLGPSRVEELACFPEMRGELVEKLDALGQLALMPKAKLNQLSLAEADLVRWLAFPTELGSVPDEIIFLRKVDAEENPEEEVYYFRFRTAEPHQFASDGWMVGWSGPFPKSGAVNVHGDGTFSRFEKWDDAVVPESPKLLDKIRSVFRTRRE